MQPSDDSLPAHNPSPITHHPPLNNPPSRRLITRRNFFRVAGTLVVGTALTGVYARYVEPHWFKVVYRDMPIRGLPAALQGKTLLQLSDFHIGAYVDSDYLIRVFKWSQKLKPDTVAITGDMMHYQETNILPEVHRVLSHIPAAPLGNYAILGNHDYGPAWSDVAVADALAAEMTGMGIRMLRNEVVDVQGLQLAGMDDLWTPAFDGAKAMRQVDPERPGLVLCHNPDGCDDDIWNGYRGWILSGHTHGGQVKPPFLPPPILPVKNKRYAAGEYSLSGGRRLYINVGLGHLEDPLRFNVRPEITLFTLKAADAHYV
ncbi:metallophosphoesterase [soil metagenome]